jgi:cellulose synthase (UDP-forming)
LIDKTTDRLKVTRFQRQEPWQPLHYARWHQFVWQFLTTMSLVFGIWYIHWRWTSSLNFDALWFALPLAIAETAAFIGLILFSINIWTDASPVSQAAPAAPADCGIDGAEDRELSVDVFFTTYSEDPELVRLGLLDAQRLSYPHPVDIRIHVLDDGRRPQMEAVARDVGVNYITRSDNVGFKAGNLRNALSETSGDFIVICDADTRPFPQLLSETLGYFRDPKVAWVQTPQWFWDIPPGVPLPAALSRRFGAAGRLAGKAVEKVLGPIQIGEDPFANDPQLFYDIILRRRNWANAAFCCGAGSIHRREAVLEAALRQWSERIEQTLGKNVAASRRFTREAELDLEIERAMRWQGALEEEFTPYKFHVSEDIYTSIMLHSDRERQWKSVQHPRVLSKMQSPNDLLSWTIQRFKYAGGTLDILFHDNPLFKREGLTNRQRAMYAATFYSYLAPLWNVVFLSAPIIFLMTGIAPLDGYSLDFFIHIIPFLLMNELAQLSATWGLSNAKGRAWYLATFPLNLSALWAVATGKKISFPVTPKDRQVGVYPRLVRWQIGFVVATLVALLWGWVQFSIGSGGYGLGAMIANTLWGLSNVISLMPIIRAAFWQPDPEFEAHIVEGNA